MQYIIDFTFKIKAKRIFSLVYRVPFPLTHNGEWLCAMMAHDHEGTQKIL